MKEKLFILLLVLPLSLFAQSGERENGFIIGYNTGKFHKTPNLDVLIYKFNLQYPDADLKMNPLYRGFSLGYAIREDNGFIEAILTNKQVFSKKVEIYETLEQQEYIYRLKYQYTSLNLGGALGLKWVKPGLSLDFGLFNMKRKKGIEEKWKSYGWDEYWGDNLFILGSTVFVNFTIARKFDIRAYYQFEYLPHGLVRYAQTWRYTPNNFGITAHYFLSTKGWR